LYRNKAGTLRLSEFLPIFKSYGSTSMDHDVQALYAVGSMVVAASVTATCLAIHEVPLTDEEAAEMPDENPFLEIYKATRDCPEEIGRGWIVQFWHLFAFFSIWTRGTDYFGTNIYKGSPTGDSVQVSAYAEGVKAGNLALALQTFVSFLYNLCLPGILATIGMKHALSVSNSILVIGLLALAVHETPTQLSGCHFNPILTPFQPHFNPISTPF